MKRLLLILTLLIPTIALSEVVEVTCNNPNSGESLFTYRFDLEKKTVTKLDAGEPEEYPLEVFETYLLWIKKYAGWDDPAVFVRMLNRKTGKLYTAFVDSNSVDASGAGRYNCTRRI